MKELLTQRIVSALEESGFKVSDCCTVRSCFDILARKNDSLLLIKILQNVEGMNQRSASELRRAANALSGIPLVVADHMKNAKLSPDVVYTRYDIHAVSIEAFEEILRQKTPLVYSIRGNYCVRINSELLSVIRRKADITQKELAEELGVSKQSIHRYESSGRISLEVAERLMKLLKEDLALPNQIFAGEINRLEEDISTSMTDLERMAFSEFRKMGFEVAVMNAPFDLLAEERKSRERVLSIVSDDRKGLKRKVEIIKEISGITGDKIVCISNRAQGLDVLVIKPRELKGIAGSDEFLKILDSF